MDLEQLQHDLMQPGRIIEVRDLEEATTEAKHRLSLFSLASDEQSTNSSQKLSTVRPDAIFNAGRAYSTQTALYWRSEQINALLDTKYQSVLDQISFRPLMENEFVLIPSVIEGQSEEELKDGVLVRVRASFVVDQEAQIVTSEPTYRDYLYNHFPVPTKVHPALKPKNAFEKERWESGVSAGWTMGLEQANDIFTDGLNRLVKDIIGRVNYLKLKNLNVIEPASLTQLNADMTFNDRTMNIGEVIYTINSVAKYNAFSDWDSAAFKGLD